MRKRNRLSTVREGRYTYKASKKIVAMIRELLEKNGSNVELADAIYDDFLWDNTPQGDVPWDELHSEFRSHSLAGETMAFEPRMKLAVMLEELDRWLDA